MKTNGVTNVRVISFLLKAAMDLKLNVLKEKLVDLCSSTELPSDLKLFLGDLLVEEGKDKEAIEAYRAVSGHKRAQACVVNAVAESDPQEALTLSEELKFE